MKNQFVHLHSHSEFSLLDGAARIKDMVSYSKEIGLEAVSVTDHGTMHGAFALYEEATKAGIKPIIGNEMYICNGKMEDRGQEHRRAHHLVVLAKNEVGYKNLMKASTIAATVGKYDGRARISRDILAEHSEGLIVASACLGGHLAKTVEKNPGSIEAAIDVACWYREVFGEDYFLEIQGHKSAGQEDYNEIVLRIAERTGIPVIVTNDSHYLKAEDADPHDVLVCIQTGRSVNDPTRMKYQPQEFFIKTPDEMAECVKQYGTKGIEAMQNTLLIVERCNLKIETGRAPLPTVPLPAGKTAQEYLSDLAGEGLQRRMKGSISQEHWDRLNYELGVIQRTGFAEYYLIVRDIAKSTREADIMFGVRGSAAGSLVSYAVGITDLDPLEYDLTFQRFLNEERISMPDVDMDFEHDRRIDVINSCRKKYGENNVASISTFGTLKARGSIGDTGRALGIPIESCRRLSSMIPKLPVGITIEDAIKSSSELRSEYESSPVAKKLIDTAKKIEGIARSASVHPAGIVISEKPLVEYTPLMFAGDGTTLVTQYPHHSLEELGILKMDFLGLKNLTILAAAIRLVKSRRGEVVDVWDIPLTPDDPRSEKAFDMIGRGETTGVFQLASDGMRKHIKSLKPTSVKELMAMVALYRPGPMAHIPRYIKGKFSPKSIKYAHADLETILAPTYGVITYQDQVLKILQVIGGFSLGKADLMRRAMGKKKKDEMEKQKIDFIAGAISRGYTEQLAVKLFIDIEPFAGYAFNGAHAACYGMIAYQTAYMKANYTAEFMAAVMKVFCDDGELMAQSMEEAAQLGIGVFPPDIMKSDVDFGVAEDGESILFGLSAIKGLGESVLRNIVNGRIQGQWEGLPTKTILQNLASIEMVSPAVMTTLIQSGALRSIVKGKHVPLAMQVFGESFSANKKVREKENRATKKAAKDIISLAG